MWNQQKKKKKSKFVKCKCGQETVLWKCPNCGKTLIKSNIKKVFDKDYDKEEEE